MSGKVDVIRLTPGVDCNVTVTPLDTQIEKHGQNAILHQILDVRLPYRTVGKLQIMIKTDSVQRQAYARIAKYDGDAWQPLGELLRLETNLELAYRKEPPVPEDFEKDRSRLIALAIKILC